MKRAIASGVGVIALGAFLAYQPVSGGVESRGGLTFTPQQPQIPSGESSLAASPVPVANPTPTPTQEVRQGSGSGGASLQSTLPKQAANPPRISGGPGGDDGDDDDYEERHHREREHHDEDEDEDDDQDHEWNAD